MRKLLETFVKYPFYANLIVGVFILAGVFSYLNMKKAFFPERPTRMIYVSVTYPGASPKEMEEGIAVRVEEAVRGIPGIKEMTSSSSENSCQVAIETTGEYDIDETLQEIKNAVDGITSMPVDAERPIVYKRRSVTPAIRLGLSGNVDLMELKKIAYQIEDDFLASGLMSQISLSGFPATEISVEVSEESLLRYGLKMSDISQAISNNNKDVSGGEIRNDDYTLIVRARSRTLDPFLLGNIVIRSNVNGKLVKISDVATVRYQFYDTPTGTWINGNPGISISINKLITEDLEAISDFVNDYATKFNKSYSNARLDVTFDFLDILLLRLKLLMNNGFIGLILVVVVLALFLSFRLSLWVAWGIPSSFLAMFVVANFYGITINMVSLFGMILVVGILVDDGIVIAENIFTHFERGKNPMRAAIDGTMEVLPAVITSVTTTIVAFIPVLLITGNLEFLFEMAFVVVISLAFSLVEAFFVLPAHIGTPHILKRKSNHKSFGNKVRDRLEQFMFFIREKTYGRVLRFVLKHRVIALFVPMAMLIITFGWLKGGIIKTTFFPNIPPDDFNVNIAFTPGEGEKQTYEYLLKFEKLVWEVNDELKSDYADTANFINFTFLSMGNSFDGQERGSHAGHIAVNLRNLEGSEISSFEIANRVREKIGKVPEIDRLSIAGRNRWGKPVSISLLGDDMDYLKKARDLLITELKKMPDLTEVMDNNPLGAQEIRLKLKPRAYILGLDQATILNQVRNGFFGAQSQRIQQGKDEVRIWVRYPKSNREQLGQLEDMKIKTASGLYPLRELVSYEIERGPVSISHYNGKREIRVEADLVEPDMPVVQILEVVEKTILPKVMAQYPGVRYEFQGQQKVAAESGSSMLKFFIPAFIIISVIIMIQFSSFGQALIVMGLIPLGYMSAAFGHMLHGIPLSIFSICGMVALSGVIVNDSVVFLQKYNSLLLEGFKVKDAVLEAGLSRFRPIVLTTLTTTIGLFPIVLETSRQAQFLIPMALALAYGVLFGTFFILIFFPVAILFLNDLRVWWYWVWNGKKIGKEQIEKVIRNRQRELKLDE
ncbi:MAG: efflux RND transporter permease subunit [Marinilabiliaceae bacterium]|nr:efflux RND transporter permease subunit [Marinilabiliaceae bacterium]